METGFMNKITGLVIALVVGGLLVGGLLIPTVQGMTEKTLTHTNSGAYFTTPDGDEHTIVIDATTITFDGNACTYPDLSLYGSATAIIGEDWFLRLEKMSNGNVQYVVAGPPQQYNNLGNSGSGSISITITGDSAEFTGPSGTLSRTGVQYMIADTGEYVLSHDPCVKENTQFIAAIRNSSSVDLFQIIRGSISDTANYESTACRVYKFTPGETGSISSSAYTVALSPYSGDLKKLDAITEQATATFTSGDSELTITIDYIIVPVSIEYDNPAYIGSTNAVIMGVVSLLGIVALVVLAANGIRNKY